MIDGFQDAVNELIEKRLEKIINSEEFIMYSETIYRDLEEKLAQFMYLASKKCIKRQLKMYHLPTIF